MILGPKLFTLLIRFKRATLSGGSSFNSMFSPFTIFSISFPSFPGIGCRAGEKTSSDTFDDGVAEGEKIDNVAAIDEAAELVIVARPDNDGVSVVIPIISIRTV